MAKMASLLVNYNEHKFVHLSTWSTKIILFADVTSIACFLVNFIAGSVVMRIDTSRDAAMDTCKAALITTYKSRSITIINTWDTKVMGSSCSSSNMISYMVDIVLAVSIGHKSRVDPTTVKVTENCDGIFCCEVSSAFNLVSQKDSLCVLS